MERRQALLSLAAVPLLAAAQTEGPATPVEVRAHLGAGARLQGSGRLRFLGLSVYDARLWVGEGFDPERFDARPLALELLYQRALKGPLIAERSIEEMRRGPAFGEAESARWLTFMNDAFPNVAQGDRITGTWTPPEQRTGFYINGAAPRVLRDAAFGPRFFGIWLAPHTSQPSLRQQLLGLVPR
jgi:Chalcone isomerase-like